MLALADDVKCHSCGFVFRCIEFQLPRVYLWYDMHLPLFSVLHQTHYI